MKKLLNYELRKLSRQKSFYICLGIMLVLSILSLLISKLVANNFEELSELMAIELTATCSLFNAIGNSNFIMVSGIFIALFACSDFDMHTVKNIYARGYTKPQVYFAKLIITLFAVTVMFIISLAFSFLAGYAIYSTLGSAGENFFLLILGQWLVALSYSAFTFALCLIIRKTGVSIALSILGTSVVSLVLSLVDSIINAETKLNDYWLDKFLSDVSVSTTSSERIAVCIGVAVGYTAIFIVLGWLINMKREN